MSDKVTPYTDDYKERCFIVWYGAGRPTKISKIRKILPKDEYGRVPTNVLIADWRADLGWAERADELDAKAMQKVDDELVSAKAEMLKRQVKTGMTMQQKGMEYLENKGLDNSLSAIQAIVRGVEIERTSVGMSEFIIKVSKMTDVELKEKIRQLSSRAETGDVIDAETEEIKPENKSEDEDMSE